MCVCEWDNKPKTVENERSEASIPSECDAIGVYGKSEEEINRYSHICLLCYASNTNGRTFNMDMYEYVDNGLVKESMVALIDSPCVCTMYTVYTTYRNINRNAIFIADYLQGITKIIKCTEQRWSNERRKMWKEPHTHAQRTKNSDGTFVYVGWTQIGQRVIETERHRENEKHFKFN